MGSSGERASAVDLRLPPVVLKKKQSKQAAAAEEPAGADGPAAVSAVAFLCYFFTSFGVLSISPSAPSRTGALLGGDGGGEGEEGEGPEGGPWGGGPRGAARQEGEGRGPACVADRMN